MATFEQDFVSTGASSMEMEEQLPRTQSQLLKESKIEGVLERLQKSKEPVLDLNRTVSELSAILGQEADLERTLSQQCKAATENSAEVEAALKRARNINEDLLEDMLMLDNLSNLQPDVKSKRKKAINGLESMLDDLQDTKDRLARHQKDLRVSLETTSHQLEEREQKLAEERKAQEAEEQQKLQKLQQLRQEKERAAQRAAAQRQVAQLPPLPDAALWQRLKLPARFDSAEGKSAYEISLRMSGLDTETIALKLSNDNTALTIRGARVPDEMQAKRLQHQLLTELNRRGISADDISAERIQVDGYAPLGQGKFGYFEQLFRLPGDVDTSGIRAEYNDGTLRVLLPKIIRRQQVPPMHPVYSARGARNHNNFFNDELLGGFGGFGF